MDEEEVLMVMSGYQHRVDDQREVLSTFVSALINSNRGKGGRKVKPTDLFDREKAEQERKKRASEAAETPEQAALKQVKALERVSRLPLPKRLREHRPEGGPTIKPSDQGPKPTKDQSS